MLLSSFGGLFFLCGRGICWSGLRWLWCGRCFGSGVGWFHVRWFCLCGLSLSRLRRFGLGSLNLSWLAGSISRFTRRRRIDFDSLSLDLFSFNLLWFLIARNNLRFILASFCFDYLSFQLSKLSFLLFITFLQFDNMQLRLCFFRLLIRHFSFTLSLVGFLLCIFCFCLGVLLCILVLCYSCILCLLLILFVTVLSCVRGLRRVVYLGNSFRWFALLRWLGALRAGRFRLGLLWLACLLFLEKLLLLLVLLLFLFYWLLFFLRLRLLYGLLFLLFLDFLRSC